MVHVYEAIIESVSCLQDNSPKKVISGWICECYLASSTHFQSNPIQTFFPSLPPGNQTLCLCAILQIIKRNFCKCYLVEILLLLKLQLYISLYEVVEKCLPCKGFTKKYFLTIRIFTAFAFDLTFHVSLNRTSTN